MNEELERIQGEVSMLSGKGRGKSFIEIRSNDGEVVIKANAEGFLSIASSVLKLAASGKVGSHFVFDSSSGAHEADVGVIFSYSDASWDN